MYRLNIICFSIYCIYYHSVRQPVDATLELGDVSNATHHRPLLTMRERRTHGTFTQTIIYINNNYICLFNICFHYKNSPIKIDVVGKYICTW